MRDAPEATGRLLRMPKRPGKTRHWSTHEARYLWRLRKEGKWAQLVLFQRLLPVEPEARKVFKRPDSESLPSTRPNGAKNS